MGKVLNQLITHENKTKKYVYDKTALQSPLSNEKLAEDKFQVAKRMIQEQCHHIGINQY